VVPPGFTTKAVPFFVSIGVLMYFILYKDNQSLWRWKFRAANHEDICVSSESYHNRQDALHSIQLVRSGSPAARTYDDSQKQWL
jgi:uncharacterized protein YegP (UPF0339 family)